MKRKCLLCYEMLDDDEITWYSDSGVPTEDEAICESCYLELREMKKD